MEDVTIEVFIHPEWSNDITKVNFLHPKLWKDGIILFRPILDEIFLELDVPELFLYIWRWKLKVYFPNFGCNLFFS
jgi:hypothetical protein